MRTKRPSYRVVAMSVFTFVPGGFANAGPTALRQVAKDAELLKLYLVSSAGNSNNPKGLAAWDAAKQEQLKPSMFSDFHPLAKANIAFGRGW